MLSEQFLPHSSVESGDHPLHDLRLDHVLSRIRGTGARSVLDLGCGSGALLARLAASGDFERLVGMEHCGLALGEARERLRGHMTGVHPLRLVCGSYAEFQPALAGFEAAAMVETIEHVAPQRLSRVEAAVFGRMRPRWVFLTTPNREYNPLLDLAPCEFRDPDHKFEWNRARFRQWARGVAGRNGYRVRFEGIGDHDPGRGHPSQMAVFEYAAACSAESSDSVVGA